MKKFNLVALAIILIASPIWSGWLQTTQAAYTATLTFANPANGGSKALDSNSRFTIDVNLSTASQDSVGTDVYVDFDSTKLDFVIGGSSIASLYPANQVIYPPSTPVFNPLPNRVAMGATKQTSNINGSGRFATLQFGLKSGVTIPTGDLQVAFSFYYISQGATTDSNITSTSITEPDLLAAPASATITLTTYVPIVQAPDITSILPISGTTAGGTPVTVTGTNFGTAGAVTFGGTAVTPSGRTNTSMTVTSPVHAAGDVYIVVTNSTTGLSSSPSDAHARYTYTAPTQTAPDITGIVPTSGTTAGGTPVTVTGTNFGTAGAVTFGGTAVTPTGRTDTSMTVTSPVHAAGDVYIVVTNSTTGLSSGPSDAQARYAYITPGSTAPSITTIVPNQGTEDGSTSVILTGTNFGTTEGTVTIGTQTVSASNVTWTSATSITFITPAYAVSGNLAVNVTITTNGGVNSNAVSYTYLDENGSGDQTTDGPNIAYLTPSSGMANADVTVTIVGTNFKPTGTTTGTVTFGNYTATILSWEDTQIRVYAPKLGAIPSDITHIVTVTRSDTKVDTDHYTYLAPASTGGTDGTTGDTTTPGSGMPTAVWFGLFSLNGGLAFLAKRKLFA
ncbi:MAG: IPT/TIG domain-containing protein [Patescibacteria group bacterium]